MSISSVEASIFHVISLQCLVYPENVNMNIEASEDDDGVLDKLSIELRFKAMKVKHLNKGAELEAWKKGKYLEYESKVLGQNGFSAYVSAGSGSDGPIWRIHGYGYGVLKEASEDDDGVLDKLSLELRFKVMKVKHLNKGVELKAWKKESIWNMSSGSYGPIRRIHGYRYGVLKV
ncbi:hypothetical protein Tco_0545583 [Tanacetum coccineum]